MRCAIIVPMDPNEVDINAPLEKIAPEAKAQLLQETENPSSISQQTKKPFAIQNEHEGHLKSIRTYSSDLAEAIKESKGSIVKIAIAEDERRQQERKEFEDAPKKNALFALGSVLIILITIASLYGIFWYKKTSKVEPVIVPPVPDTVIKSEFEGAINVSGMTRTQMIPAIRASVLTPGIRPGTIKNVKIVEGGLGGVAPTDVAVGKFLKMLDTHASNDFIRALSSDYMVGIYLYEKANLFFVLTGQSHDYLQKGMIDWEPFLFEDIAPLFGIDTMGDFAKYNDTPFKDVIVENREARAVVDENNKPLFFYTFLNPETIFISVDPKTLTQAVLKLRNQ